MAKTTTNQKERVNLDRVREAAEKYYLMCSNQLDEDNELLDEDAEQVYGSIAYEVMEALYGEDWENKLHR